MKTYKSILILLLLFTTKLWPQENLSTDFPFFPLEVGNEWIYETFNYYVDTSDVYFVTFKVASDTIMPNGKTYFELTNFFNMNHIIYFRTDEIDNKVYVYNELFPNSEFLVYDFNPNQQSYLMNNSTMFVYTGIDFAGNLPLYKDFFEFSLNAPVGEFCRFSKDIGVSKWIISNWGFEEGNLIYAKVNGQIYGEITSVESSNNIKKRIILNNYPNPFNPKTTINYYIPETGFVSLKIHDSLGREIKTLVNEEQSTGNYKIDFYSKNLSSGIYFYRLKTKNYSETKKMILLK